MAKRCKYIYKGKTYSKEEFMALLAGGEYENILAEYESVPSTGMTEEDFASIESSGVLGTGTISVKSKQSRSKYIDSLSLERLPLHENVTVTTNVNPATLNGQTVSSTLSDKLIAGILRGKDSAFKFLGGVGYGPATGRWWAFSRLSDAEKLINSTEVSKDGYKYLVPALMSDTSHLSNKNMTIMVMNLFKEAAANKELNTEQFKALVDKTFDKKSLSRHKPYITKVMEKYTDIDDLISGIQEAVISGNLTFEDRKSMISSFVGDSTVNKPKFKTIGTLTELAEDLSEPIAKDVPLHNAVVIYRTKGDLKAVETDKDDEFYHESYSVHVESSSQIEVLYLDGSYPITDLIPEFTTKGDKKNPSKTYRTDEEVMSKIAKGWTVERALTNLGRTHGLSAYSAPINIKAKASKGVSAINIVSSDKFSSNSSAAVSRIREVSGEDGATLNLDGTDYTNGGLVVPAGSFNVSQQEVSEEGLYNFLKSNEQNISSDIFKIGLYRFPDRAEVSYDLNIVIPREHRDIALEFGRLAGQESLFDLDTYENIKTGSDGKNPISFTPKQLASIAKDLSNGILPDVEGMLKGDRSGAGSALKDVESTTLSLAGDIGIKSENIPLDGSSEKISIGEAVSSSGNTLQFTAQDINLSYSGKKKIVRKIEAEDESGKKGVISFWRDASEVLEKDDLVILHVEGTNKYGTDLIKKLVQEANQMGVKRVVANDVESLNSEKYWEDKLGFSKDEDVRSNRILDLEGYRKAKADGSNPELVQAVEDLLGQPTTLQEGVKGQAITDLTLLFKKSQELFDKISDAAGGSKKRSSAEERRKFMDDNPDIKYIDDNMAYIYKQIEDNNLGKKEGNCPL